MAAWSAASALGLVAAGNAWDAWLPSKRQVAFRGLVLMSASEIQRLLAEHTAKLQRGLQCCSWVDKKTHRS